MSKTKIVLDLEEYNELIINEYKLKQRIVELETILDISFPRVEPLPTYPAPLPYYCPTRTSDKPLGWDPTTTGGNSTEDPGVYQK